MQSNRLKSKKLLMAVYPRPVTTRDLNHKLTAVLVIAVAVDMVMQKYVHDFTQRPRSKQALKTLSEQIENLYEHEEFSWFFDRQDDGLHDAAEHIYSAVVNADESGLIDTEDGQELCCAYGIVGTYILLRNSVKALAPGKAKTAYLKLLTALEAYLRLPTRIPDAAVKGKYNSVGKSLAKATLSVVSPKPADL